MFLKSTGSKVVNFIVKSVSNFIKVYNAFNALNPELYTFEKAVYNSFLLTVYASSQTSNFLATYFIVISSLIVGLILDIVYHEIGKKFGIATLRFRTFHSRTVNGKLLSFLVHLSIWDTLLFHHFSLIVIGYMAFALYMIINKVFLEYTKLLKA